MGLTFQPTTDTDLSGVIQDAIANGTRLEVCGGGTKRAIGRAVHTDACVTVQSIAGITDYDPTELVVTAGAGTPVRELTAAMAAESQHFAFEPRNLCGLLGVEDHETIGGLIAANLSGPRRFTAGGIRDHVLGFQAVSGRGELFKSGGRVVKNVTGYDLSKLVTGSFGTLAVLTEVSLRVVPRPREVGTLLIGATTIDDMRGHIDAVSASGSVTGAAFLSRRCVSATSDLDLSNGPALAIRFEGDTALSAARAARDVFSVETKVLETGQSTGLWEQIRDLRFLVEKGVDLWRISLPRTSTPTFVKNLDEAHFIADWAGGQIWLADSSGLDIRLRLKEAAGQDGHATLIRAKDSQRTDDSVFHPQSAPVAALSQRIKHHFDPKGVLNPGRMYADI
jgi:glycolate oxidase FAD binding subunit